MVALIPSVSVILMSWDYPSSWASFEVTGCGLLISWYEYFNLGTADVSISIVRPTSIKLTHRTKLGVETRVCFGMMIRSQRCHARGEPQSWAVLRLSSFPCLITQCRTHCGRSMWGILAMWKVRKKKPPYPWFRRYSETIPRHNRV